MKKISKHRVDKWSVDSVSGGIRGKKRTVETQGRAYSVREFALGGQG